MTPWSELADLPLEQRLESIRRDVDEELADPRPSAFPAVRPPQFVLRGSPPVAWCYHGRLFAECETCDRDDSYAIQRPELERLEDPRVWCVRGISRQWFRDLPMTRVCVGTLGEPFLVFDDRDQASACCLRASMFDWFAWYERTPDVERRKQLARWIDEAHLKRVALAIGYKYPDGVDYLIRFAPDA